MRSPTIPAEDVDLAQRLAEELRAQWRLFERVTVRRRGDGEGYQAMIQLNPTLVRGAAEQQSFRPSAATAARLEARRLDAIAACIDRVNEKFPASDSIQDFVVLG